MNLLKTPEVEAALISVLVSSIFYFLNDYFKSRKVKKAILIALATEYTYAFERLVMLYKNLNQERLGKQIVYMKSSIFHFEENFIIEICQNISDENVIRSIIDLKEKYFHVKKQLDPGSDFATQMSPLGSVAHKARTHATKISGSQSGIAANQIAIEAENNSSKAEFLADYYQTTALAFISDATWCFENKKEDITFNKIITDTENILRYAIQSTTSFCLNTNRSLIDLEKKFDQAKTDHKNIENELKEQYWGMAPEDDLNAS